MLSLIDEQMDRDMETSDFHIPVMSREVMEYLRPKAGDCIVDGTLGLGGHARQILERIGPSGRLIGIDRDLDSLQVARQNLAEFTDRCRFVHRDFRFMDQVLDELGIDAVDGILLDLGISSFQLDNLERGFSIKAEGPLDMRMDQQTYLSAYDLINSLSEKEISLILKHYGEERWHHRIARFLVENRPITTTKELSDLVLRAMPRYQKRQKIHPATRTFQAFRIAVNRELESLEIALSKCADCLKPGGQICVISFHSLEDRIVKHKFRELDKNKILTRVLKKPLQPRDEETRQNPRARSAKLRVAERRSDP